MSFCCPYCGESSHSFHNYRYSKLQFTEMFSQNTKTIIANRLMNWANDKLTKKTFMEPLKFAKPYARRADEIASRIKDGSRN